MYNSCWNRSSICDGQQLPILLVTLWCIVGFVMIKSFGVHVQFWLNFTCTKVTKYLISGAQPKSSMRSGWSPWKEGPIGVVSECSRDTIFSRLMAVAPYLYLSTVFLLLLGLMYRLNELLAGHSALQSFVTSDAFHSDWAQWWFRTAPRRVQLVQ